MCLLQCGYGSVAMSVWLCQCIYFSGAMSVWLWHCGYDSVVDVGKPFVTNIVRSEGCILREPSKTFVAKKNYVIVAMSVWLGIVDMIVLQWQCGFGSDAISVWLCQCGYGSVVMA